MIKPQSYEHKVMIKKIAIRICLALAIIFILYLWVFGIFSNLNNFWKNFRGNDSSLITLDNLPPIPPYINKIPKFTNKDYVEISGTSEIGTKVELYLNGVKIIDTIADKDGSFNFGQVKIQPSKNIIFAVALDESENKSVESIDQIITFDNAKPKIEVIEPKNNETYNSKIRTLKVYGKTKSGSKVVINSQIAIMQEDGSFISYISPVEGGNKVLIEAFDLAGNSNKEEIFFTFNEE